MSLFANILVIGQSPECIRRVRRVLQAAGYIVHSVAGHETVRTAAPDLVLVDVHLPDGEGFQFVRTLKADATLPFIPVIMIALQGTSEALAAALDAGADEFVDLSEGNAALLTRVRAMLRLKDTTDALAELNATLEQKVQERTRELERAYAALRQTEKLSSLGRMAATIAHEINNPLTGIMGLIELIRDDCPVACPTNPHMREDLEKIEKQLRAIGNLVQQLRDFSRPPRRERRAIVLNAVVEDVLGLVEKELHRRNIHVQRAYDPALPPVCASAEQMAEILLNLILNAQDAMPNGGTLTLRTFAEDGWVHTQVADTGTGIPPDVLERIFEPFFTTKGEQGTGLGLAICHSIARDHGGDITVESSPGAGVCFTIRLPALADGQIVPCEEADVH